MPPARPRDPGPEGTPTPEQLRAVFRQVLAEILEGGLGGPPTDLGFDLRTWNALRELGELVGLRASQAEVDAATNTAKAALKGQLDGTNAELDAADISAMFEARGR